MPSLVSFGQVFPEKKMEMSKAQGQQTDGG